MKKGILFLFIIVLANTAIAQWQQEWTSESISSVSVSGWLPFELKGDNWEYRFYGFDVGVFNIMSGEYSNTVQYLYNLTQEEIDAGYLIYALGVDLTGDNITEFYVLSSYGNTDPKRQGFRIFDIVTGNTIFRQDDALYYYSEPYVWDADNDGVLECTFAVYDYPDFSYYTYEVYDTGINTYVGGYANKSTGFKLKQNYPNPFNPSTNIEYSVPKAGMVDLSVYSITGEKVIQLVNEYKTPGIYKTKWNGRNSFGLPVSSGNYIYSIVVNGSVLSKKMVLIK